MDKIWLDEGPNRVGLSSGHQGNLLAAAVLALVLVATLASLWLIYNFNILVLRPFRHVMWITQRVIDGDLSARVGIRPPGEMGVLCDAIDRMTATVAQREEQLKQATRQHIGRTEKLASIGRLAAGVAHEINNPLTGVLTFACLLRDKPNMGEEDKQDLDLIIHETTRAAEIVRGLLDFARERPFVKEPLDINEVVRRTVRLIRNQKSFDHVVIEELLEQDMPLVSGDMNQLQQVFLNLSLNACEAMPNGGKITIRSAALGDHIFVTLSDTGCGIKQEHFDQIFEPFFTTKPVGKGTGLGLSVSYGIVRKHGGTLEVESEDGCGARFIVGLPASGTPALPAS
jgi:two-component system NtrC family sensor kinase